MLISRFTVHGSWRRVEAADAVDGADSGLARHGHRRQWRHLHRVQGPREAFGRAGQWAGHLTRPRVVGGRGITGRVEGLVAERLHQSVKLRAERRLEVGRHGRSRVHGVAFALAPLGPSVLEPHLQRSQSQMNSMYPPNASD